MLLKSFFEAFDVLFLSVEEVEPMLNRVKESLEDKIRHNESAMPVITALGGQYDRAVDEAKAAEITALLELLRARKELRTATENEARKKQDNGTMLAELFGI